MSSDDYITQKTCAAESDDSCDEEVRLNMRFAKEVLRNLHPANEIVARRYAPDPPIQLKLLSLEHKQTKKPRRPQHRYYNIELRRRYGQHDTINNYFQDRLDDLLYLKFDNQRSMTLAGCGRQIQYFAGYFHNVDGFARDPSDESIHNIYERDAALRFAGFHPDVRASFCENSLQNDDGIRFSSNFQSANLFAVFRVANQIMQKEAFDYELVLQNDVNSRGNTQWFYFAVEFNQRATYRFNIINFVRLGLSQTKSDSLYNRGMKIATFSHRDFEINRHGWSRNSSRITYHKSQVAREGTNMPYHTLRFEYTPAHEYDVVLFAHCYPYTLTDLECFLERKMLRRRDVRMMKLQIGRSISGLPLYVLRLGDSSKTFETCSGSGSLRNHVKRKSLVFMARQHSGETPASYVLEGIVDALVENKEFDQLKKQFVIHIVPMVNPDGVFYGNYRTNLSGHDLNRRWRNPNRTLHPEVYYVRKYLSEINRVNPIALIIDLHGHSRKINSFFYGNPSNEANFLENTKVFPLLCSKVNKRISYQESTFYVSEDKKNTARVVLHELFPHALVYTFEASFYGFHREKAYETSVQEFTVESYKRIGRDLLQGYLDYININNRNHYEARDNLLREISIMSKNHVVDDDGSDSEPEQDSPDVMPLSKPSEIKALVNQAPELKLVRSSKNFGVIEREVKVERPKKGIEISTQTDNQLFEADAIQPIAETQEGSLSILRIFPMKTNFVVERNKGTIPFAMQQRRSVDDSLKTVRKSNNDFEQFKIDLGIGQKPKENGVNNSKSAKDKLLSIKNIPTLSHSFLRDGKLVERSIWNHKSMIVRYR